MCSLSLSLVFICVWSIWTSAYATVCGENQRKVGGRCCDLCPPGEYVKELCSDHQQTVCSPCAEGFYSDQYNIFDACEECQSCQENAQKCTPTTNAKCFCRPGFLCSNSVCSTCEENKCVMGEKVNKTDKPMGKRLIEYSYRCEPICSDTEYFDVKEKTCKPRAKCSLFGLSEHSPGNITHNSVCDGGVLPERPGFGGDIIHVILGIGFVLISLTLLGVLSYASIKKLRKHKPDEKPVSTTVSDFHLSKEESGLQLIIQVEPNNEDSWCDSFVEGSGPGS
nr:tumor necrosis factor receptor superfamily member 3-like isoform X1 [Labrus bergylta]